MWKEKDRRWRRRERRDEIVKKYWADRNYRYKPSVEAISKARYDVRIFRCYSGKMSGVTAIEEMVRFLDTEKTFESPIWYSIALKVAYEKVKGRKFYDHNCKINRIENPADVEQSIAALLATAGINKPVRQFVKKLVTI